MSALDQAVASLGLADGPSHPYGPYQTRLIKHLTAVPQSGISRVIRGDENTGCRELATSEIQHQSDQI